MARATARLGEGEFMVMVAWIARGLLVLGAVALTVGLANILAPAQVFPSRMTCMTDYDLLWCYTYPWAPAPWLAIAGGAALATGWAMLRPREASGGASGNGTT
jgi:hypothetical protein